MDFLHEIPGDEFKLIAKNLESEIIKIGLSGIMLKSKVMRNTVLRYLAGTRIHELTDTEGNSYVLFAYEVESVDFDRSYFENADAMTADAFTVKDRTGAQHSLTLHQLPFFDPDKRIPRGLEVMEFTG